MYKNLISITILDVKKNFTLIQQIQHVCNFFDFLDANSQSGSGSILHKSNRIIFVFKVHYLFSSAIHTCILIFFAQTVLNVS